MRADLTGYAELGKGGGEVETEVEVENQNRFAEVETLHRQRGRKGK